jgi:hypothetical protein
MSGRPGKKWGIPSTTDISGAVFNALLLAMHKKKKIIKILPAIF